MPKLLLSFPGKNPVSEVEIAQLRLVGNKIRAASDPQVQKPNFSISVALPDPVCGVAIKITCRTRAKSGCFSVGSLPIRSAKELFDD